MSVVSAMTGVVAIFCIIAVGFVAAKCGHFSPDIEVPFTKITLTYAVPALVFYNTAEQLSPETIGEKLGWYILLPFLIILSGYAISRVLCKIMGLSGQEGGAMNALFSMSNVIFIGLPVCLTIFGEWSAPYVVSYLPANTILFWTIGNIGMMPSKQIKTKELLKQVLSPPLVAFLVALPLTLLGVKLPGFLISGTKMLGGMATPAALLIVGATLSRMELKKLFSIPKMVAAALIGRCMVMPVLAFTLCRLLGAPSEMTIIFTVISGMPAMTQAVLVARRYDACVDKVAHTFALTTLCSMLGVPLVVFILAQFV